MNPATNPLENLSRPGGSLKPEPPDAAEISGLLRTGRARLIDAGNASLALESRFDLAYNAAHALCLAALRAKGYRAANRYVVFQVLPPRWAWGQTFGACWTSATTSATWGNTKACSK
ncbi:hypothetical protein [Hydrogenophaga sp. 5NK40-0174]|uniref:hypothetical protein n=1 Tax=Hydrogenophaga sp. 5NK40-0174 TaxID=3127649 RepID=UPI00310A447A